MWYEKLNVKFDIDKLRKEVEESVFTLGDQVIQGKEYENENYHGFGGWSILSRRGDWCDGWEVIQHEHGLKLENFLPTQELIIKSYKHFDIAHSLEHDRPTQAYVGEIKKVIDQLKDMGFQQQSKNHLFTSHSKSLVHQDSASTDYMARIHIPLWTNQKCVHICQGEHLHMPADGSAYIMWVNLWHQIRNDSDEPRYHIIMDAYDTKKITNNFKYEGNFEELENFPRKFRQDIDDMSLTQEDIDFFEAIKEKYVTNYNV
jgi:hypothetical protein